MYYRNNIPRVSFSKLSCIICSFGLVFITSIDNLNAKRFTYNEWVEARENMIDFRFMMNEAFHSNARHLGRDQMIYFEPLIGNRDMRVEKFDPQKKTSNFKCAEYPTLFYRSDKIIYFPKLGRYLRLYGRKDHSRIYDPRYKKCRGDYRPYSLYIAFEEVNEDNKNLKPISQTFKTSEIDGMSVEKILMLGWYETFGVNCSLEWGPDLKCYNELDVNDYERFFFMGSQSDKLKYWQGFNSKTERYETITRATVISWLKLDRSDPNKRTFKDLLVYSIMENAKKKQNNKVLIIVPKKQVGLFMRTIKKIPDNAFADLRGYVWFESKQRYPYDEKPYYPREYDVLPNDKYDAELARISNGNLKAKYGRYLTKERYSEDYIAPSIYNNNYNDKPEW